MGLTQYDLAETGRTILHELPAYASGLHANQPYQVSHFPPEKIIALRVARE